MPPSFLSHASPGSRRRQLITLCLAAAATIVSMRLLPEVLANPSRWANERWWSSRSYFYGLYAALWPAAIVGLFGVSILPIFLPRSLRHARLTVVTSRTALLVTILVSLMLLVSVALTPVL
jgi:hypothetical protein